MAKSIRDSAKKGRRGRKRTTGPGKQVLLRLHPPLLTNIDSWIRAQEGRPTRPEAIRRILEQALAPTEAQKSLTLAAEKAAELAARTVEKIVDKSQPVEEQKKRKRSVIAGPSEFRDIREDLPKSKT
jgi:hypothetical protein